MILIGTLKNCTARTLSFNNILDISAATSLICDFEEATVAILKHTNPCGVGSDSDLRHAWEKAFATDKQAPFGGIIICNREIDESLAKAISEIFSEVIIAPDFSGEARTILQKKKICASFGCWIPSGNYAPKKDVRSVCGGLLVQDPDTGAEDKERVVSKRQPTQSELEAMRFGWRVVKHVKSNAIVYSAPDRTLGIGAGQMSRVDSSRIAVWKARGSWALPQGERHCQRRVFPICGRPYCRRRCRCDLRHSAGRINARRRGDRGCRRTRDGNDFHRRPSFSALKESTRLFLVWDFRVVLVCAAIV